MIAVLLKVVFVAACLIILVRAEHRTATLGKETPLPLRYSFFGLLTAALTLVVLAVFYGYRPDWPAAGLAVAVAVWLLCERRAGGDRRATKRHLQELNPWKY